MAVCSFFMIPSGYKCFINVLLHVCYIVIAHLIHFHDTFHDFSLKSNVIYKVLI